jgi:hypothetical protein
VKGTQVHVTVTVNGGLLSPATTWASPDSIYPCRTTIPLTDNHLQQNRILFGREPVSAFQCCHFGSAARPATIISLLALATLCPAQESASTFKVDVKLVNVFVTVTDEHGAPVGGLKKDDFILTEDGRAQKLAVFRPRI